MANKSRKKRRTPTFWFRKFHRKWWGQGHPIIYIIDNNNIYILVMFIMIIMGKILIDLEEELHKEVKHKAIDNKETLNAYITKAIQEKIARGE